MDLILHSPFVLPVYANHNAHQTRPPLGRCSRLTKRLAYVSTTTCQVYVSTDSLGMYSRAGMKKFQDDPCPLDQQHSSAQIYRCHSLPHPAQSLHNTADLAGKFLPTSLLSLSFSGGSLLFHAQEKARRGWGGGLDYTTSSVTQGRDQTQSIPTNNCGSHFTCHENTAAV